MNRNRILSFSTCVLLLPLAASADESQAKKATTEQLVREYILEHPEALLESLQRYQQKQQAAQQQRTKEAIAANQADLVNDAASPALGKRGGITIVQFFDYRCGYCKKVSPTLTRLLADNPDVRVVFKEFPILGPESHLAAKASLAAGKQDVYLKFHEALMGLSGAITTDAIEQLGSKLGLDVARLKADIESPAIEEAIQKNYRLAEALSIRSTPTFVVGSVLAAGAQDESAFKALIEKARAEKPASVAKLPTR